jgi:hypothetical protein
MQEEKVVVTVTSEQLKTTLWEHGMMQIENIIFNIAKA